MKDLLIDLYLNKKRKIDEGVYYITKNNKNKNIFILLPYVYNKDLKMYDWSEDKIYFKTKKEMTKFANKLNIPINSSEEV